jgi:hypothetical protein|nr:MAG TPA: hypothetical protein [Caudoviricetes sp.]
MNKIIKFIICTICYAGILRIANVEIASAEYWIVVILLIIESVAWGTY